MYFFYITLLSLSLWTLPDVNAAQFAITDPLPSTVWKVGSAANIRWKKPTGSVPAKSITVYLTGGDPKNASRIDTVCDNLSPSATSCRWDTVPSYLTELPSGYGIQISDGNDPAEMSYSARFQIKGGSQGDDASLPVKPAPKTCVAKCEGDEAAGEAQSASNNGKQVKGDLTVIALLITLKMFI